MQAISVGSVVEFEYPRHNFYGVRTTFERRRVKIEKIRDILEEPIRPATLEADPLKRRGRLLITGTDLDKNAERSFYVESMHIPPAPRKAWAVYLVNEAGHLVRTAYRSRSRHGAEAWAALWNASHQDTKACVGRARQKVGK